MALKSLKKTINFTLSILILTFFAQCSKKGHFTYNGTEFKENQVYIFFRETDSKSAMVSKSYNVNGYNYSHVGVGAIIRGKLVVYHILYDNENKKEFKKSDLRIENIENFYNPKNDQVISGAIVSVIGINALDFSKFKKILKSLEKRKLKFDKKFGTYDDDDFYCSELVYYIINNSNNQIIINPIKKKLSGIDLILLRRDTIIYYPADIFLKDKNFQILKRW